MERDEIVKMAREAGWPITDGSALIESLGALIDVATEKANERANASWASMCEKMVAAEREACAKVCEETAFVAELSKAAVDENGVQIYDPRALDCVSSALSQCAVDIRARGES